MSSIQLATRNDLSVLAKTFQRHRRIQIPDLLTEPSANEILHSLEQQKEWNLAWNLNGQHRDLDYAGVDAWADNEKRKLDSLIFEQAAHEFQYRYAAVPIYDIYHQNLLPGHFFNEIYEFINSSKVIELVRKVTGYSDIKFADIQATRYSKGHFLTVHDDAVEGKNRLAAYVINLTPDWKEDWGGALIFPDSKSSAEAWFPQFNLMNLFAVPQKHAVTVVSPFTPRYRYSLTGWFRSG